MALPKVGDVYDADFLWNLGPWSISTTFARSFGEVQDIREGTPGRSMYETVRQFVSLLDLECHRLASVSLSSVRPFDGFSYVAAVSSAENKLKVVFGTAPQDLHERTYYRYAIHMTNVSQSGFQRLARNCERHLRWTDLRTFLPLDANKIFLAPYDRFDDLDEYAESVLPDLLGIASPAREPHNVAPTKQELGTHITNTTVVLRPISLYPPGPYTRNDHRCFVLMPFADDLRKVYDDAIVSAATQAKLECRRADEIFTPGGIMIQVWESMMQARVVVADLTNMNPNVFYELGLAHAIGHDVILLTQDMKFVPFDLKHMRCIVYTPDEHGLRLLEQNLRRTLKEVLAAPAPGTGK